MERNRKKRNYKKERGITLVALIITIIVMLILVAVTVRVVVESDIIGVAEKAAESKETGELKDQVAMKIGEWQLGKYVEETKDKTLTEYLNEIEGVTASGTSKIYCVTKGDTVITVNEKGEIMTSGEFDTWDGTKEVPEVKDGNIYIHNAEQFKYFADSVNGELEEGDTALTIGDDTVVYLMANLDLGARPGSDEEWGTADDTVVVWTPIGPTKEEGSKFTGTFEGNGHVISGVYVSKQGDYAGIFGCADTIQNLTIKDSYIEATGSYVGGIVGRYREGEIVNCHNINTAITGNTALGGIIGMCDGTKISQCSNSGAVSGIGMDAGTNITSVGGIVGTTYLLTVVEDCNNSGTITGVGSKVGGIAGETYYTSTIKNCKNTGLIIGNYHQVGGITGGLLGNVEKCYNKGNVQGNGIGIGGIVGTIGNGTKTSDIIIKNTYNTGTVIAEGNSSKGIGGILGFAGSNLNTASISNNYNVGPINITGSGVTYIGGTIGYIVTSDTIKAEKNYYLETVVTANGEKDYEEAKTDQYMKTQAFVDELNTGLTEKAWVKTSEYPALIGM